MAQAKLGRGRSIQPGRSRETRIVSPDADAQNRDFLGILGKQGCIFLVKASNLPPFAGVGPRWCRDRNTIKARELTRRTDILSFQSPR
jgi:hypothetical protein